MMIEGKELAIKVAEKLNDKVFLFFNDRDEIDDPKYAEIVDNEINNYLHDKAAEILFSEGMAGKIHKHLADCGYCSFDISGWFGGLDNNGTLTPQKILTVWLEM